MNDPRFSLSLTRSDVVMWFLRVLLWSSIVGCLGAALVVLAYFSPASRTVPIFFFVRTGGGTLILLVILLLFPSLLVSNVLGRSAHDPVTSLTDIKPLIGRCLGLHLFLYSLPQIVLTFGMALFTRITSPNISFVSSLIASPNTAEFWLIALTGLIIPAVVCVLGFFLAFGPAIRDNFRSHS